MFFTVEQISSSISGLANVHAFHGITYLTCKAGNLPVDRTTEFPMDSNTARFMREHHKVDPNSTWFFQPYKTTKQWVRADYPSSGLQAINTQTFSDAFIHPRNSRIWGWQRNYVSILKARLSRNRKIPAFHMAVWLFKYREWPSDTTFENIVNHFFQQFQITEEEKAELFDLSIPKNLTVGKCFKSKVVGWEDLRPVIPAAPDAKPDQGGTLSYLETKGIGPAENMVLEPTSRLTLITGDNGLGKTFLLECAWWCLTGFWADRPAYPSHKSDDKKISITFEIDGEHSKAEKKTIFFDLKTQSWPHPKNRPTIPGLIVYARVDGSFAVWDPEKQGARPENAHSNKSVFSSEEVWNGLSGQIEGLIRDWVRWQNNPSKYPFDTLMKVLDCLAPPDLGGLKPGEPVRIPDDPRDIPTIVHPYGETPILYSSAGVRRIITLAYLIVWAWNEHLIAVAQKRTKPQRRMVVLVDEMEAHLHPKWQRAVLPALMSTGEMLSSELEPQFIVATHSPLVMVSAEPVFDDDVDCLYHLDLDETGKANLGEVDFVRFGDVSSWLTSPVFELRHARSREAEAAIEDAKKIQMEEKPSSEKIEEVSQSLVKYLASDDRFWPRWISYAEKYGIKL